jgi:uncharacterized protein DUF6221
VSEISDFVSAILEREYRDAQLISQGGYGPQRWEVSRSVPDWPFADYLAEIYALDLPLGPDDGKGYERSRMALVADGRNEDEHIARYDPERICLEIEAKRRILARHTRCANGEGCCSGRTVGREFCDDMADLAAPYAGRPGFRPEWSVDA